MRAGVLAAALIVAGLAAACGSVPVPAETPDGPCLGDLPEIANIDYDRLASIGVETGGGTEFVRFQFDRAHPAFGSVTAEPAQAPFFDAGADQPVVIAGDRLTSIRFEGLAAVPGPERYRRDPAELGSLREVTQVADRNFDRWVVGTAAGACLRLRVDKAAGTVTLLVSPS